MRKFDKIKKLFISVIILSLLMIFSNIKVLANSGYLSYESSQSIAVAEWQDDYDYYDDWGYDDGWGYDAYYYDSSYMILSLIFFVGFLIVGVVIIVVIFKKFKGSGIFSSNTSHTSGMSSGYSSEPDISESQVENKIRNIDPNFSREEFITWSKDVFVKLQYAWSDRDLDILRCFETPQLFEHHSGQIQKYIKNGQINKLENVSINWAKLFEFKQDGSREVLNVLMNTKMIDYIINEQTGKVIKGNNTNYEVNTYKLTFVRSAGVKTVPGTTSVNVTNCPNCGAPVQITSSGKCSYCGSVITTGNFSWVLSNMELYKEPINDWVPYNDGNIGSFGTGLIAGAIAGGVIREIFRPRPHFGGFGPRPPRGPGGPGFGPGGPGRGPGGPRR